ncbi:hypothetical protein [Sorangium sp. So ce1153]|uniref:hypothetical protein n=1 Tax=Sorangium sp. So ce1153 TaxID=3133333 RepID=UPI003F5E0029
MYRFIAGIDEEIVAMGEPELAGLRDPFAELVLKRGASPVSLRDLLAAVDRQNGGSDALPGQSSFVVGEGSQIAWTEGTEDVKRAMRLVVTRNSDDNGPSAESSLFISTAPRLDDEHVFLQVLAWDPVAEVFNYYLRVGMAWVFAGDSSHALAEGSRGRGAFDSHVNGALVMKELRAPWINWHSVRATVDAAFAPDDPIRSTSLFQDRSNAELFEPVVRAGIQLWNDARIARALRTGKALTGLDAFMRQVLETTTVNLVSSDSEAHLVTQADTLTLPSTLFVNVGALLDVLELQADLPSLDVPGELYLRSLERHDVARTDGKHAWRGDTYFAFLVPEPAFEDIDVVRALIDAGIMTPRLAASLLMVDFPNPIYSSRRRRLMRYVPEKAPLDAPGAALERELIAAVAAAAGALPEASPERELLANWAVGEGAWRQSFTDRIARYMERVAARLATEEGFDACFRLAESRRRRFRRLPLDEFSLLLPTTNLDPSMPWLRMNEDGTVEEEGEEK